MESIEFKEFDIKNRTCYYFDDIIEIEDFDFNSSLTLIRLGFLRLVFLGESI